MRLKYLTIYIAGLIALICTNSCTNLDEKVYNIITDDNFYKTKENVIQAYVRPFEHAYWAACTANFQVQENTADHFMTPNRQGHWLDGQVYFRLHWHKWTIDDGNPHNAWNNNAQGAVQCNSVLHDFSKLNPEDYEFNEGEFENMKAQIRVLRAWYYLNMFDMFRNIPLVTEYPGNNNPHPTQASPKETFEFLENELKETLPTLNKKEGNGGNGLTQGQWTQAGAAALLVKLYLNAEHWIGEDRYSDCETYATKIINGEYGSYGIAQRWDAPFDWQNENCEELIYAFTSSYGYSHHVYSGDLFWWGAPYKAIYYFGFTDWGDMNPRFSLQPGLDLNGNEYPWANGKPVLKFKKYPDDVRLKKYKNLGNSTREGMFLYGHLDYIDEKGEQQYAKSDNGKYTLYIRDQVGWFEDTDPSSISPNPTSGAPTMISDMNHADQNSGWCLIKYPIYRSDDQGKMESDYALIRLAEIYYSLAECKFRAGDKAEAERLLNIVRKRYYPEGSTSLYKEDGSRLTEQELIDEWGREFIGESLRRTVLCRFGVYNEAWWDKEKEESNHTTLMCISRKVLDINPSLKQNPGYPSN